jgi:hypothetical protein
MLFGWRDAWTPRPLDSEKYLLSDPNLIWTEVWNKNCFEITVQLGISKYLGFLKTPSANKQLDSTSCWKTTEIQSYITLGFSHEHRL